MLASLVCVESDDKIANVIEYNGFNCLLYSFSTYIEFTVFVLVNDIKFYLTLTVFWEAP